MRKSKILPCSLRSGQMLVISIGESAGKTAGVCLSSLPPLHQYRGTVPWGTVLLWFELVGDLGWISDFTLLVFLWLYSTLSSY